MIRGPRRGSAILEGALTLTIALVTLIVIVEVGITMVIYQGAAERARHGARYAAVNPTETQKIKNVILYGTPTGSGSGLFGITSEDIAVNLDELDNENSAATIEVSVRSYRMFTRALGPGFETMTFRVAIPVETGS